MSNRETGQGGGLPKFKYKVGSVTKEGEVFTKRIVEEEPEQDSGQHDLEVKGTFEYQVDDGEEKQGEVLG